MPWPKAAPNRLDLAMTENDCEDQGFTRLEDGCYNWSCRTFVDGKVVRQQLVKRQHYGEWFWECPKCRGSYGSAPTGEVK